MFSRLNFFAWIVILATFFVSGKSWVQEGRIVGGSAISIQQAPYQALILSLSGKLIRGICGGAVVSQNHVLTAAHCTYEARSADLIGVQVGTSYFNLSGIIVRVAENIVHPNYNTNSQDYDVAILRLKTSLQFSDSIQSIPLANPDELLEDGVMCTVSGWGSTQGTSNDGSDKSQLRAVNVPIYNRAKCNRNYRAYGGITLRMICAGYETGGKDSCHGDSGGPLICPSSRNKKKVLYGVVSFGVKCAQPDFPGVYTRLQVLRNWINFRMRNRSKLNTFLFETFLLKLT